MAKPTMYDLLKARDDLRSIHTDLHIITASADSELRERILDSVERAIAIIEALDSAGTTTATPDLIQLVGAVLTGIASSDAGLDRYMDGGASRAVTIARRVLSEIEKG
jgi:hypothetical protein